MTADKRHIKNKSSIFRIADKGNGTIKMTESFRPPFSKGGTVEGVEPSSLSLTIVTSVSALQKMCQYVVFFTY